MASVAMTGNTEHSKADATALGGAVVDVAASGEVFVAHIHRIAVAINGSIVDLWDHRTRNRWSWDHRT